MTEMLESPDTANSFTSMELQSLLVKEKNLGI